MMITNQYEYTNLYIVLIRILAIIFTADLLP